MFDMENISLLCFLCTLSLYSVYFLFNKRNIVYLYKHLIMCLFSSLPECQQ